MPHFLYTGWSYVIDDFSGFSGWTSASWSTVLYLQRHCELNWPVFLFSCSSVHDSLIITLFLTACDDVRFSEVQVFLVWTTVGFYLSLDSSVTLGPLYTDEVVICD